MKHNCWERLGLAAMTSLIMIAGEASLSSQTLFYSNYGPNNTYNQYGATDNFGSTFGYYAMTFTSGQTGNVTQIDIGVTAPCVQCYSTDTGTVSIWSRVNEVPGTQISPSWPISVQGIYGTTNSYSVVLSGLTGVKLTQGSTYFLVVKPDPNSRLFWMGGPNNGPFFAAYYDWGNSAWWLAPDATPGAFDIIGQPLGCQVSVAPISQSAKPWGGLPYDHLGLNKQGKQITIASRGCALTSLNMGLNFAGPLDSNAYVPWDPGSLNSNLNLNGGYGAKGRVDWLTATRISSEGTPLRYDNLGGTIDSNVDLAGAEQAVENELCAADPHPVIVGVRSPKTKKYPGHFVLITGEIINPDGTKAFMINDPASYSSILGNTFYMNLNGQPEFQTRGIVNDPPDLTGLSISASATVNLLVTDPNGNVAGFDPSTGDPLQYIAHSAASIDEIDDDVTGDAGSPVQNVTVNSPSSGRFGITLTGQGVGEFVLNVGMVASDGTVQTFSFPGLGAAGSSTTYALQYSPAPGSTTVALTATFQSTLADISDGFALGLIKNQSVVNVLSSDINAAADAADRGDFVSEKNYLNTFVSHLNFWSSTDHATGGQITGVAPQVLINDANSLLSQIP
jgi:hypothetical protein